MLSFFFLARAQILLGDAAIYARQIEAAHFGERSLHVLYYVVGWAFVGLLHPLGVPTDEALIGLSGIFMTAALWQCWGLYRELGEEGPTARWALLVLLFSGVVIQQGTEAEAYALQLLFSVLAYRSWLRHQPVRAGIGLGLATLCSPLGVLAVGFFVADAIRTRQWRPFVVMGVAGALTFLPVLAFVWRDYFYGTRGLLTDEEGTARSWASVFDNGRAILRNFHWMLPFMAAGFAIAWRERSRVLWLLAGLVVFHAPAIMTVTENGVFLLPFFPLLAAVVARGVRAAFDARGALRTATVLALVLYAATSLWVWMQPYDQPFRQRMMEGLRRCPPGSTVITTWSFAMTLGFYGGPPRDTLVASRHLVYPEILERDRVLAALRAGEPVYVMESHYPNRGVRWFFPAQWRERHRERHSMVERMERRLGVAAESSAPPDDAAPHFFRLRAP